jgi:hypothetical protein
MSLLIMDFCTQAKLFFAVCFLILLYLIIQNTNSLWYIGIVAIITIATSFGINKMCNSGLNAIAWMLAIFPPVIYSLFIITV